jgi:type II secretion system protein H
MILPTKRGFTLIEVLLVTLIIGFIAAIATPSFVNSLKGQRLRQATRSVMGCGRYARTMAVSRQRAMTLTLSVGGSRISVDEGPAPANRNAPVYTREQVESLNGEPPPEALPDDLPPGFAPPPPPPPKASPARGFTREFEGVTIKRLSIRDGLQSEEGAATILYKSNGTCPPYEVVLADEDGKESIITVDFLGDATHEQN